MSYSMSYTWYDVTCNVGICKSKSTLRDTSYHIRRMTGWALSYCGMRVAGGALYHKVALHSDVTPRYAVTSLRVTLSRDFSPDRHPAIRHIHANRKITFTEELFIKARQRVLNGESQRKLAAALGTKESTLRKWLKAVSTDWKSRGLRWRICQYFQQLYFPLR